MEASQGCRTNADPVERTRAVFWIGGLVYVFNAERIVNTVRMVFASAC